MNHPRIRGLAFPALALLLFLLLLASCASVPREVVELSYLQGRDLLAVQQSHDAVIHQLYDSLRDQRRAYLDEVWFPRFLASWRQDGELVAIAQGTRIWSDEADTLIDTPPGADPRESLQTLDDWVSEALAAYRDKEAELVAPLDQDEAQLRALVRESFERMMLANSIVTAHLNSLREVQEVQDGMLQALDLADLRDRINARLARASRDAAAALERVREADRLLD